jgi:hypothetical protein
MKFNVERLCELAGIDSNGRLLSEGAMHGSHYEEDAPAAPAKPAGLVGPKAAAPAPKAAAPAPKAEGEHMLKGAKNKMSLSRIEELEDEEIPSMTLDMMEDEATYEDDETVYEIDEQELNEAIYKMRSQRIEEGKVRHQVRKELKQVVSEMGGGTSWMYGDKKPTNSRPGSVGRGFAGPGFKR